MAIGYHLYVDEAGDDGVDRVRPLDPDGSSEWFVLAGVLVRSHRRGELQGCLQRMKAATGLAPHEMLHFRDLGLEAQRAAIAELAAFRAGLVVVASNKRNMRRYRNRRVEAKNMEVNSQGRSRPQSYNYFYNGLLRYMLETVSAEANRWNKAAGTPNLGVYTTVSYRKGFNISQTKAYLHKLKVARHGPGYFNSKRQITWATLSPSDLEMTRAKAEPALQIADCVASAVYRALDEDRFGTVRPELLEIMAPRLLRPALTMSPEAYGFKLLPDGFKGPASADQRRGLQAVGIFL
ncbi:DUF3800 domain-containing protein [Methylobacterium planeticum]|uniref:DUF3800 domain-containing protein n=1 Tax=Methylobacterium planeticum TaxID=2615211 RepID=UPI0017850470|nr:DUF3800 domain-containing protein [Methylobacterium planeticum]